MKKRRRGLNQIVSQILTFRVDVCTHKNTCLREETWVCGGKLTHMHTENMQRPLSSLEFKLDLLLFFRLELETTQRVTEQINIPISEKEFSLVYQGMCVCSRVCWGHNLGEAGGYVPSVKRKNQGVKEEIIDSLLSLALRQPERVCLFVSLNSICLAVTLALPVYTASFLLGNAWNDLMNTKSGISSLCLKEKQMHQGILSKHVGDTSSHFWTDPRGSAQTSVKVLSRLTSRQLFDFSDIWCFLSFGLNHQ